MARGRGECECCYSYSCFVSSALSLAVVAIGAAIVGYVFIYASNKDQKYVSTGIVLLVVAAMLAYPSLLMGFKAWIIKILVGENRDLQYDVGQKKKIDRMAWMLMSEHVLSLSICWAFFLLGLALLPQMVTDFIIWGSVLLGVAFATACFWVIFLLVNDKKLITQRIEEYDDNKNGVIWTTLPEKDRATTQLPALKQSSSSSVSRL
jgi:hypothetical protein